MLPILEYILMLVYWILSFFIFMIIFREENLSNILHTIFFALYTAVPSNITDVNNPNYTEGIYYEFTPFKIFQ